MRFLTSCLAVFLMLSTMAGAQEFSGLARVLPSATQATETGDETEVTLSLSQGVPFRVFTETNPERVVLDFQEVDWSGLSASNFARATRISGAQFGGYIPGWSRLVLELAQPMEVTVAAMEIDTVTANAVLTLRMSPTDAEHFAAHAGAPVGTGWDLPAPAPIKLRAPRDVDAPLVVMLDPGHGGLDPGAETDHGVSEKHLVLRFAYELGEMMMRTGNYEVLLTREGDYFVSLERRIAMAHQAGADLFISLHADSLAEGVAHGASVYTLSEEASDIASQKLAERHDRSDLLLGTDLSATDDEVTDIMLDLARVETQPRSQSLAESVVSGLEEVDTKMYRRPLQSAGFSVLKSADIPSILIELGYLSSPKDFVLINDPKWRARTAQGILNGLNAWRLADEARRGLVRQ